MTLIPLAIRIVQIQDNESPYLLDLVRQAQTNLASAARQAAAPSPASCP